ncbi:ABC transporter ATP-binding protein [Terasakiella sp. A23]|uniref:ABC transporter ATP-binding protein n=1 Tax=Terasakiella sp. FCG-A23 TaxID=3080561 RepID=UPI002952E29D|nr:ABC transporter ATP-binding protein [Terasakiella sp. A23]MDV7341066.1 ABC transporter ATP-binding protein [Terasakiella sp. A23]
MADSFIEIKGVTKLFKKQRTLDDLSLSIDLGDRIALVGSNGAGKTTIIRCLLGEYTHDGEVLFDGINPRLHRQDVLGRIGFVPQIPPPLRIPVNDLVKYVAGVCHTDMVQINEIAQRMGLVIDEVASKPFIKLSGGQKQKLLIAMALGRPCDLMVFDEPTANLDPAARQVLFDLLAERSDKSMIISSHRLEEVAALVNRVVEMDRGRIVLDDHVEDAIGTSGRLKCEITVSKHVDAFARTIGEWNFTSEDNLHWTGEVAGPDRLRFLGTLSRYAGLIKAVHMDENGRKEHVQVA